jgi:hypothetical protein
MEAYTLGAKGAFIISKGLYVEVLVCLKQVFEDLQDLDIQNGANEDRLRKVELEKDCHVWQARCMRLGGERNNSETLIRKLIGEDLGAPDARLRIDPALTYANMGNCILAKDCIKSADACFQESHKGNTEDPSHPEQASHISDQNKPERGPQTARSAVLKQI